MKSILLTLLFVGSAFVLSGCGAAALVVNPHSETMHDYNLSSENQILLNAFADKGYRVKLGEFTDLSESNKTITCRLMSDVHPPKDESYRSYIAHAFEKEFKTSKLYDAHAPVTIDTKIEHIEGSSVYGDAYWKFDITLTSSNGAREHIVSTYTYESSISAYYACHEMYRTFPLAVQKLIGDVLKDPGFATLLQPSE
jgi:hypothetical protein